MFLRILLIVCCLFSGTACLSKNPPAPVRWFMPAAGSFDLSAATQQRPLHLAPVTSRTHLREPMVWRLSPVELFFDDQERWGARPAEIVQGVLEEALFVTGPFTYSDARDALALTIELQAFEGVYAETDVALCEISVVHDDGQLVRQEKFRATIALDSREPDDLARGLGQALHEVAMRLREWAQTSG